MQAIVNIINREDLQGIMDFMKGYGKLVTFVKSDIQPGAFRDKKVGELFVTANPATVKEIVDRQQWIDQ